MNTYIVATRRNLQTARNQQYAACLRASRPFITVAKKRRFASIELDMYTTSCNLDDDAQSEIETFLASRSEPDANVGCGSLIGRTSKIRVEIAEKVAGELYSIAERIMQQQAVLA